MIKQLGHLQKKNPTRRDNHSGRLLEKKMDCLNQYLLTWWGYSCWTVGFLYDRNPGTPSENCHPKLAVEGVSNDSEQLVAGVSGQAVNKQTQEDSGQDLTEQHS